MSPFSHWSIKGSQSWLARSARRFCADVRGATAIEFGMVALPFFAMVMAIMMIGTQYLTTHFLEHSVTEAARKLRTGEAQKAGLTLADFRKMVCDESAGYIPCNKDLVVHITSGDAFSDLVPAPTCLSNGALRPSQGNGSDGIRTRAGNASKAVLVTACYEWQGGGSLWRMVWNLVAPGAAPEEEKKIIISAATAFRSEPFE